MTKLSIGKAEDLAGYGDFSLNKDILLVPAMNVRMWVHKATQKILKFFKIMVTYFLVPKGERWHVVNMVKAKCQVQDKSTRT